MRRILIVGGGYAGFYAAWKLEKNLRHHEAEVTLVDPVIARHTDFPVDERGFVVVRPDLRVGTEAEPVADAWAAGDDAAVPDLASPVPGARTVPNAQHAYRQGKLLARNIIATLRGRAPKPYVHHSLGAIATLGLGRGIFQYQRLVLKGLPAWLMHRGYHVLAVPTWERKVRVLAVWLTQALFGRDILSLASMQHPRVAFVATPNDRGALSRESAPRSLGPGLSPRRGWRRSCRSFPPRGRSPRSGSPA
ncbi:hypothetical protein [Amycolatopsis sp. lyj-109]|uniref:hypothetical protein n=1 Tax=Amycolatopsis sp. lyj-109 TaxID=2789287 RepID=UPI00397A2220